MRSPRTPFWLRMRLLWRREQGSWFARRPDSFTEKVRWKMLKDRRPLLTTLADKAAVRDYVARQVGSHYLTTCFAIAADSADLVPTRLPREFVAKVTHSSGGTWIVSDSAPSGAILQGYSPQDSPDPHSGWHRVLSHPDDLDWAVLRATFQTWLGRRAADDFPEWCYVNIPPHIIVEEVLTDSNGSLPMDYKFFVFHGTPRLVEVDSDRYGTHQRNLYSPEWSPVEARYIYPPNPDEVPPPPRLGEMLHVASALGEETDFVRVDLYNVDGRIVFGELTHYPEGARFAFNPEAFDIAIGRHWQLPRRYR